jgi:hypothetical protein
VTRLTECDDDQLAGRDLAREVLDEQEFADYLHSQRDRSSRAFQPPRAGALRINDDGYDQYGDYHSPEELFGRAR